MHPQHFPLWHLLLSVQSWLNLEFEDTPMIRMGLKSTGSIHGPRLVGGKFS